MEFITDKIKREKEEINKLDLNRFQDYVRLKIMKKNFELSREQWVEDFKKIVRHNLIFVNKQKENSEKMLINFKNSISTRIRNGSKV